MFKTHLSTICLIMFNNDSNLFIILYGEIKFVSMNLRVYFENICFHMQILLLLWGSQLLIRRKNEFASVRNKFNLIEG
mgnify:CR=1 FL=1